MKRRMWSLLITMVIALSQVLPVAAQDPVSTRQVYEWEATLQSMQDLSVAPQVPIGSDMVTSASMDQVSYDPNEECFWGRGGGNPLDEQGFNPVPGGNFWEFKAHNAYSDIDELGAYSGDIDYWVTHDGTGDNPRMARIGAYAKVPQGAKSAHVYGAFRVDQGTPSSTPDKLYFRVLKWTGTGYEIIKDVTQITDSTISFHGWQSWSYRFPDVSAVWDKDVYVEVWAELRYHPGLASTKFVVDYTGVAYCNALPDVWTVTPPILEPASINTLYAGLVNRPGEMLWKHVTNAIPVFEGSLKSVEKLVEDDEFYKAVFRNKPPWDVGDTYSWGTNPNYSGGVSFNKLFFTRSNQQVEWMWENLLKKRFPSAERLTSQAANWRWISSQQQTAAIEAEAQGLKEQAQLLYNSAAASAKMGEERLKTLEYLKSLSPLRQQMARIPITIIAGLNSAETSAISTNNLGWDSVYLLLNEMDLSKFKAIEVPLSYTDEMVTELWRSAVINGAPRSLMIIRGSEAVRISFWEKFYIGLRYTLPAMINGGISGAIDMAYLYRAYTLAAVEKGAEFVPWVAAVGATVGVGDAAWDSLQYKDLTDGMTTLQFTDYLLSQNVYYRILAQVGLVEYQEQWIGKNWSTITFCYPYTELVYHRYPDYHLQTMVMNPQCAYMEWRIVEANSEMLTIQKNVPGRDDIRVNLTRSTGYGTYTIWYDHPDAGAIAQHHLIDVIQYFPDRGEAKIRVYNLVTETPEQMGLCAGASPSRPKEKPCAEVVVKEKVYLPGIQR